MAQGPRNLAIAGLHWLFRLRRQTDGSADIVTRDSGGVDLL